MDQTPVTIADFGVQALVSLGNFSFLRERVTLWSTVNAFILDLFKFARNGKIVSFYSIGSGRGLCILA